MERRIPPTRARRGPAPVLLALALVFTAGPAVFAQTPWIHVEVTDDGSDADRSNVKVNLPLSVVQVAIAAAPDDIVSRGRVHLRHVDEDIDIEDLRRMWRELEQAGDAELVTVEDGDETVTIRREGDRIRIDIEHDDDDEVRVEVPVALVNALLSGEGETLNVSAALSELSRERGEIVRVRDGASSVRIWIDER